MNEFYERKKQIFQKLYELKKRRVALQATGIKYDSPILSVESEINGIQILDNIDEQAIEKVIRLYEQLEYKMDGLLLEENNSFNRTIASAVYQKRLEQEIEKANHDAQTSSKKVRRWPWKKSEKHELNQDAIAELKVLQSRIRTNGLSSNDIYDKNEILAQIEVGINDKELRVNEDDGKTIQSLRHYQEILENVYTIEASDRSDVKARTERIKLNLGLDPDGRASAFSKSLDSLVNPVDFGNYTRNRQLSEIHSIVKEIRDKAKGDEARGGQCIQQDPNISR